MLELEKKEGEDYTREMMLNELMETVKAGKVIAPVGTKTLWMRCPFCGVKMIREEERRENRGGGK